MLSRLSFRNVPSQLKAASSVGIHTTTAACSAPRMKRPIESPPVRIGFIPDEWFQFFYPKTGVTGPYVFLGGLTTYLLSKEYYVIEHEFYGGVSLLSIYLYVYWKHGDQIGKFFDKKVDEVEAQLNNDKNESLQSLDDGIKALEKEKWRTEGQLMLWDIKKQNIFMQLEATYRERLAKVHREVKNYLDYHAQMDAVERRISQKHMVQWITNSVLKSITPEQEKANLLQCIKELEVLSAKA